MAAIAFPAHTKTAALPSGTRYAYAYIPATEPNQTTLFFLHGFPSSPYDFRHQIAHFTSKGYGILAPDLLGYGGTDKPTVPAAYKFKTQAADLVALLDHIGLTRVHAIGHDFGSLLLSQVINYHPMRFLSASFLAVPYFPPGEPLDIDAAKALTEEALGFERFGYIRFFNEPDSWQLMDEHIPSFVSLFYGTEHDSAMDFYPAGKLEAWLRADRRAPRPPYLTAEELETAERALAHGGCRGPTNWYRARFGEKVGVEEERTDGLDPLIPCPALYIEQRETSVVHLPYLWDQMGRFAERLMRRRVSTESHWVQLASKDEVNAILDEFLGDFGKEN